MPAAVPNAEPHRALARRAAAPSGMTLLEVVLAVTLLAMLFGLVFSVIGTLDSIQMRNERAIAASEVAHRLILAHLDDDKAMPNRTLPIDYGRFKFMYDLSTERVVMGLNKAQSATNAPPQGLDRFEQVTIEVLVAEPMGDYYRPGERVASLSRIYDPFAPRNPDSAIRYFQDPSKLMDRINKQFGAQPAPKK